MIELSTLQLVISAGSMVGLGTIVVTLYKHYHKKKENRYDLLKNFFVKLSEGVLVDQIEIGSGQLPRISQKLSDLKESQYFKESIKHLNKDIPAFPYEFENLQKTISAFEDYRVQCKINILYRLAEICRTYKMNVTLDEVDIHSENVLSITGILNYLIPWWLCGTNFNHSIQNNSIIIQSGHIIASLSANHPKNIEFIISAMKKDPDAHTIVIHYKTRMALAINTGISLNKEIQRIIAKIEKEEYNTTCDECIYSLRLPIDPRVIISRLRKRLVDV